MLVISGECVCKGIALGTINFYNKVNQLVTKRQVYSTEKEVQRFKEARDIAIGELQVLYEKSVETVGQENALIFGIHQMLIEDEDFVEEICKMIREDKVNAEYAIETVSKQWEEILQKQRRDDDMRDISRRLLNILAGTDEEVFGKQDGNLLVAGELLPSEIIKLDAKKIAGIVLLYGNPNSHAVILTKAMGIPMMVQAIDAWDESCIGKRAVLDAEGGKLYVEPDDETMVTLLEKQGRKKQFMEEQQSFQKRKTKTQIYANVGSIKEAEDALRYGADGIGLVRSEIFCLSEQRILDEDEQFEIYKKIAEIMVGRTVVIRTWDFDEDKQVKEWTSGENRGIRWCLEHKELFKIQLRAICRASNYGDVAVMFPMVSTLGEVKEAKQILENVKAELKKQNILFDDKMKIGVMLETPAAIVASRSLAKQVDFCSIGTNDLIQYTFGINRQKLVEKQIYEEYYSTLVNMIRTAVTNVHAEGKSIGICGELGADLTMTEVFIKMKLDILSVTPNSIFEIREKVIEIE